MYAQCASFNNLNINYPDAITEPYAYTHTPSSHDSFNNNYNQTREYRKKKYKITFHIWQLYFSLIVLDEYKGIRNKAICFTLRNPIKSI